MAEMREHKRLSVGWYSQEYGLSPATIYRLISAGKVKARKVGVRTLILEADWWAYLDSVPVVEPVAVETGSSSDT